MVWFDGLFLYGLKMIVKMDLMLKKIGRWINASLVLQVFLLVMPFNAKAATEQKGYVRDASTRFINFFDTAEPLAGYGFLMNHHPSMRHLVKGHFASFQLGISGRVKGGSIWHHMYNFPYLGLDFYYTDMAYPQVLGQAWALMPSISFRYKISKRLEMENRNALGLAYLTRWYHPVENHKNEAIGRARNIALSLNVNAAFAVSTDFKIKAGFGITHFSCGAMVLPNKGLNIPSANLGLVYNFRKVSTKELVSANTDQFKNSSITYLVPSFGFRRIYPIGGALHAEFGLQAAHVFALGTKARLGPAVDVFHSYSDKELLIRKGLETPSFADMTKWGLAISYEQVFENLSFVIQSGYYVRARMMNEGPIYNRFGFRYELGDNLLVNLTLKTHLFRADYVEYGIGWKF